MSKHELPDDLLTLPTEKAVRLIALFHLRSATAACERLQHVDEQGNDDVDDEALHDFRVSIRRLRCTYQLYRQQLRKSMKKKVRKKMRGLLRSSNPGRDVEVQISWVGQQNDVLSARERAGVDWLLERLEGTRGASYEHIRQHAPKRLEEIVDILKDKLRVYEVKLPKEGEQPTSFGALLGQRISKMRDELDDRIKGLTNAPDDSNIHKTRIFVKRFRYLIEPARNLVSGANEAVASLKRLQDVLGDLHDAAIFGSRLKEASDEALSDHQRRQLDENEEAVIPEDRRPGLVALKRRLTDHREALHQTLETEWLLGDAADLIASLAPLSEVVTRAGTTEKTRYLLREHPLLPSDVTRVEVEEGWLSGERVEEGLRRLRHNGSERLVHWVKLDGRTIEEPASEVFFAALWPLTEGKRRNYGFERYETSGAAWRILETGEADKRWIAESESTWSPPPNWLACVIDRELTP